VYVCVAFSLSRQQNTAVSTKRSIKKTPGEALIKGYQPGVLSLPDAQASKLTQTTQRHIEAYERELIT